MCRHREALVGMVRGVATIRIDLDDAESVMRAAYALAYDAVGDDCDHEYGNGSCRYQLLLRGIGRELGIRFMRREVASAQLMAEREWRMLDPANAPKLPPRWRPSVPAPQPGQGTPSHGGVYTGD